MWKLLVLSRVTAICLTLLPLAVAAKEIRFAKQLQINNLPIIIIEKQGLFEKHAKALGGDLEARWLTFVNGGATIDALLAGNVDFVTAGLSNFAIVWSRSRGDVRGIAATAGLPLLLLSRDPKIKTIADYGPQDRIAVPTVKVSNQAVMLNMALEKLYGDAGRGKLDAQTVQLGHPDAVQVMMNPKHEIKSHFGSSPYAELELKNPDMHVVLNTKDLFDGPSTNNVMFATTKFHDTEPLAIGALIAALDEANAFIRDRPREAAQVYLDLSKDHLTVDEVVAIIQQPGAIFSATPTNTLSMVQFMARAGLINRMPSTWKELYFPEMHARNGS